MNYAILIDFHDSDLLFVDEIDVPMGFLDSIIDTYFTRFQGYSLQSTLRPQSDIFQEFIVYHAEEKSSKFYKECNLLYGRTNGDLSVDIIKSEESLEKAIKLLNTEVATTESFEDAIRLWEG